LYGGDTPIILLLLERMEDLKAFEKFFAYEPTFEENPVRILEDIL
jgi:hypothetical protein